MKKFNLFSNVRWLLVPLMLITLSIGQLWGATYNLVTDANTLSAGDQILIVSEGRSVTTKINKVNYTATYSDLAMNTTVSSNHLLGTDVNISSSSITSTTATEFTLSGNSSGWKIYNGTSYLYADARNKLTTSTEENGLAFTFSINSTTGVATITTVKEDFELNKTTSGSLVLRLYAASTNQSVANTYFVLYAASNTTSNYDVFIYKKVPSCNPLGSINGSVLRYHF